jgi:hypothetical protein
MLLRGNLGNKAQSGSEGAPLVVTCSRHL